jgi:hypothetical protein
VYFCLIHWMILNVLLSFKIIVCWQLMSKVKLECGVCGTGHHCDDLKQYADTFLAHNINGRRLLLLTQEDLLNMGIVSVGHRRDLHVGYITHVTA